jgi:hypothetical protein
MMDLNWCFCGALPDITVDNTSSQHNTGGADDETINSYSSVFTNTKINTTLVIIPNEDAVVKETGYNIDTTMKKFMRRWHMSYRRNNNKRRRGHNERKSFFHRWTHRSSSKKNIQLNHPIYTQEEFDKEFDKLLTLDLSKAMSAVSESAKSTGEKTPAGATCKDYEHSKDVVFQSFLRKRSIPWTKRRSRKVAMENDYTDTRNDEMINCMYSYDEQENVEVKSMLHNQRDIKRVNSITKNKEVMEHEAYMCDLSNALTSFMENRCDADACISRNPDGTTLKSKDPDDAQSDSSSGVSTTTDQKINHRSKLGY